MFSRTLVIETRPPAALATAWFDMMAIVKVTSSIRGRLNEGLRLEDPAGGTSSATHVTKLAPP